jgi:acrylyl-CoA reductase (NADPH)
MTIGTTGPAVMNAAQTLDQHGVLPESGAVAVTGATEGMGSLMIVALREFSLRATAATRRLEQFA